VGILHFFGHEGHDHGEIAAGTIPWWQDELTVSVALILGFVVALFLVHYVFKAKFPLKLTVVMAYLLIVGVACYSVAPILSIAALTVGMALALTTTMLALAHKTTPK
jgi:FtsH-binding integral membrane protein